jgi:hypothetical protein
MVITPSSTVIARVSQGKADHGALVSAAALIPTGDPEVLAIDVDLAVQVRGLLVSLIALVDFPEGSLVGVVVLLIASAAPAARPAATAPRAAVTTTATTPIATIISSASVTVCHVGLLTTPSQCVS